MFCFFVLTLISSFWSPLAQSKEADLQAIEQVLSDPGLNSDRFREWKDANSPLLEEIYLKHGQQGVAEQKQQTSTAAATAIAAPVVETSL